MEPILLYRKTNKTNLYLAIMWLGYGVVILLINGYDVNIFQQLSIVFGILYLLLFFYEKRPYYSIKNKIIKKEVFPKQSFNFNALQKINKTRSGYVLVSKTQETFKITSGILKDGDSNKLISILNDYEAKI